MTMLKAIYEARGPHPERMIKAVPFTLPSPQTGQAIIQVLAAPVNPSDLLMITGKYGILPSLPATGGSEGVGRVLEIGPNSVSPMVGSLVLLPTGIGSWASHVLTETSKLIALPDCPDPQQLSMLTINPPTAQLLLEDFVKLEPGEWVIQNAANSAVGGYLIQLAKLRGLKTLNIVRRGSACEEVLAQGGTQVLLDGEDLRKRAQVATGGEPIRLGIDAVGGMATEHLANCLTEGATLVNYGALSGEPCLISPKSLIFNDISLKGFWLAQWFRKASRERKREVYASLTHLIATGQLSAKIQATYPLEQIQAALAAAWANERSGKILIVPTA